MKHAVHYTWLTFLIWLLLPVSVWSQAYDFSRFSIEEGLSQSQVNGIIQDANGRMWFATIGGGLCRYDGRNVKVFRKKDGLPGNAVQHVAFDQQNKSIYISAEGHKVSRFDGAEFTAIKPDSNTRLTHITGMLANTRGALFVSSSMTGLWMVNGNDTTISSLPSSPDSITAMALRKDGWPVFSTRQGEIISYDENGFTRLATWPPGKQRYIGAIHVYGDSLIIGTGRGIYFYYQNTWKQAGPQVKINSLFRSEDGSLWAGTQIGAIRYTGEKWEQIDKQMGLTDLPVLNFFPDREGNLWIATGGGGAFMFRSGRFRHFGEEHGLSQEVVMALASGPGGTWIGTSSGLFLHDGETIRQKQDFPFDKAYIATILPDSAGNVWVLSRNSGLVKYTGDKIKYWTDRTSLPDEYLTTGLLDDDNSLWMASSRGLIYFDNDQFELFSPGEETLYVLWGLLKHKEGLLCGFSGGLRFFDGQNFHKVPGAELIEGKTILGIVEGPNDLLYLNIYNNGLYVLDPHTSDGYYLSTASGLTSDLIFSMIIQGEYLYLGTERGIDRLEFDRDGILAHVRNYGRGEGFKGVEANRNAVMEDSLGRLWFGNIKGVALYDPGKDKVNLPDPMMVLNSVKLFYETPDWAPYADSVDIWHNIPVDPYFPHDQNHLIFDFSGNSFVSPDRIRYRYRLDGFDKGWSPEVESGQAMYANLPPGDYTFRVEAIREGYGQVGQALTYPFVIGTPIWGQWWFMVLVGLGVLLLVKIVSDNRVRIKLEKAMLVEKIKSTEMTRLRKELARDFHDEIGNHFASISVLVQMLGAKLAGNAEVKDNITKLEQLSRSLYLGGRDFIWSIEPENEHLHEMILYIKDFGEELFEASPVTFRSHLPDVSTLELLKLAPGANRQVIMIGKEAMTNTLKHSRADNVYLKVWLQKELLYMEIMDDGCGLRDDPEGHSRGLKNMKKRAERVGGTLSYLSNDKEGLSVLLVLSVNAD